MSLIDHTLNRINTQATSMSSNTITATAAVTEIQLLDHHVTRQGSYLSWGQYLLPIVILAIVSGYSFKLHVNLWSKHCLASAHQLVSTTGHLWQCWQGLLTMTPGWVYDVTKALHDCCNPKLAMLRIPTPMKRQIITNGFPTRQCHNHSYRNPITSSCHTHRTRFIFELRSIFAPSRELVHWSRCAWEAHVHAAQ